MTDRIIVSRKELEMATAMVSQDIANILREIIDTAEEAESAWITDRAPTVEEVGDEEWCNIHRVNDPRKWIGLLRGEDVRLRHDIDRWCRISPFTPPVKRQCWCGAEMRMRGNNRVWWAQCLIGMSLHGTGPTAPTESAAWAAYDKMVGR